MLALAASFLLSRCRSLRRTRKEQLFDFSAGRRSRRVAADFNGVSFVYRRSAGFLMVKTAHVKTEVVGRAEKFSQEDKGAISEQ
jgi:hypothetical protein